MTPLKSSGLILCIAAAVQAASTQVSFQGVITSGPDHVSEAVTLQVVLSGNASAYQPQVGYYQDEDTVDHADLFSSITGTGLAGAWTRPSNVYYAPFSAFSFQTLRLTCQVFASSDFTPKDLGLTFYGNTLNYLSVNFVTDIYQYAGVDLTGTNYSNFLDGLRGTYASNGVQNATFSTTTGDYSLVLSSMTVSGAVPEPSAYGLALGGLALAAVAFRRRRA